MDGRRRQWITWDVYFNGGDLGVAIRERFGGIGMLVFNSFICASKRSPIQGRMTYMNDADALTTMGIPGMPLIDEHGNTWTLDELWTFLGRQKQIRRERRGRVSVVISTRWERWQKPPGTRRGEGQETTRTGQGDHRETAGTPAEHLNNTSGTQPTEPQTSRSDPTISEQLQTIVTPETDLDPDVDLDPEIETDLDLDVDLDAPPPTEGVDEATTTSDRRPGRQTSTTWGEGQLRGFITRIEDMCSGTNREVVRLRATHLVALAQGHAGPDVLEAAVQASERHKDRPVMPDAIGDSYMRECRKRGLPAPMLQLGIRRAS